MSKSTITELTVTRRILVPAALGVAALFLLALIPGPVGKTFWVAFLLGLVLTIVLSVLALIQSRRSRTR